MRPTDFQTHLEITTALTPSRVFELARHLRSRHVFPHGHKHSDRNVKIWEAALFIWVAFTNTSPGNLQFALMYADALENNIKRNFFQDLVKLLSTPQYLQELQSLELTTDFSQGVFAIIKDVNNFPVTYGRVPEMKSSIVISGDWLRSLAFNLYRTEYDPFAAREQNISLQEAFEQADPKIFESQTKVNAN